MIFGTVKWFCNEKGYGFIEPDDDELNNDIFIHLTAVERSGYDSLEKGQKVKFHLTTDNRKNKQTAEKIEILN